MSLLEKQWWAQGRKKTETRRLRRMTGAGQRIGALRSRRFLAIFVGALSAAF